MTPELLLVHGIKAQVASDSTEMAQRVAQFVITQRPGVRMLDNLLRGSRRTIIPTLFGLGNGARCYLRMRPRGDRDGVIACAHRDNEKRAVAQIRATLGSAPWCDIDFAITPLALRGDPRQLRRLARLVPLLEQRYDLMQGLRAIELVCHYARLGEILDEGSYKVAVMSSYTNPWGIALNVAARRRKLPVALVMHGMPFWPLPRLDYDLAIVNSLVAAETLRRAGCELGRVIIKSGQAHYRPMKATLGRELTAGILLSKGPRAEVVTAWIRALLANPRISRVLVRKHPANLWADLPSALAAFPADRVGLTANTSSFADVRACDVVVAGNSSVHLDALAMGVPSIYVRTFDHEADTVLTFASDRVVAAVDEIRDLDLDDVARFYAAPSWTDRMRRHVNIDESDEQVSAQTRAAFAELAAR